MTSKKAWEPEFELYGSILFYEELELEDNEKSSEKFIKDIERIIRTSLEYKNYIKYLKTEALLKRCTIMNAIPDELMSKLSIEMHHCPLTLYDLVDIVLRKHLVEERTFTRLSIANEVMDQHYLNRVGLVPMTITLHQLIHTGEPLVHKDDIFGNYSLFYNEYEKYFTDSQKDKIEMLRVLPIETVKNTRQHLLRVDGNLYIEQDFSDFDKLTFIEEKVATMVPEDEPAENPFNTTEVENNV